MFIKLRNSCPPWCCLLGKGVKLARLTATLHSLAPRGQSRPLPSGSCHQSDLFPMRPGSAYLSARGMNWEEPASIRGSHPTCIALCLLLTPESFKISKHSLMSLGPRGNQPEPASRTAAEEGFQ